MTTTTLPLPLTVWQRRIVVIAWITYAAYYLGRVNISTAMPDMQASLDFTKSQVGLISTGFFWAYALGQLINGQLGDRISPRRFVLIGMLVSALINLIFAGLSTWSVMVVLWTINGYMQATGWGPIVRTLANWLTTAQRRKVGTVFGSCFVAGNALTWLLTGWLVANFGWRSAFWLPAVLLIFLALTWYVVMRDTPEEANQSLPTPDLLAETSTEVPSAEAAKRSNVISDLLTSLTRFWSLMISRDFSWLLFGLADYMGANLLHRGRCFRHRPSGDPLGPATFCWDCWITVYGLANGAIFYRAGN